jgi:hypothetical protein
MEESYWCDADAEGNDFEIADKSDRQQDEGQVIVRFNVLCLVVL